MKSAKSILTGCLLAYALLSASAPGWTDELSLADLVRTGELSFQRSLAGEQTPGPGLPSPSPSTERGVPASDAIRGNGTRAGYMLSHGGIVPNSETVTLDGSMRSRNKDYYLDVESGMLAFAEPVRTNQLIRVSYRYVPEKDARRTSSAPVMSLNIGQQSSLGITYAYKAGVQNQGFDLMTYGLSLDTKLGAVSNMKNMLYMSSVKDSGRVSLDMSGGGAAKPAPEKPKSGNMFVHNSDLRAGRLNVKLDYQDVSKDFNGFASLKQQKAAPETLLNQLEKEKGIRRFGLRADYDIGSGVTSGFGISRIGDSGGDIVRQSFNLGGSKLKLSADFQEVDPGFRRFGDLAENERAQWAKERGIKRSAYQLSLAPLRGMPADSPWNALSFSEISDKSGSVSLSSVNFAAQGFSLSVTDSRIDAGFARLGDLKDSERAQMALNIRRQFDPNAAASNLTKQDLDHIARETGIERRDIRTSFRLGDLTTGLQFLTVGDDTGEVKRQSISLEGANYKVLGMQQEIGEGFSRVNNLAPIEQQNFGKENGMKRTNLSGEFKLHSGLQMATSYERVRDGEAGLSKYGVSLKNSKLSLAANYQDIDPDFDRVMDLADADRQKMAAEQGMKRYDLSLGLQAGKSVRIDSFYYDAKHSTDDRFRRQLRNNIVINPSNGPKLSFLRDEVSFGSTSSESAFLHQKLTLAHKMGIVSFNMLHDTVTTQGPDDSENKIETRVLHFDTDPKKNTSIIGDWKSVTQSDGRFEETQTLRLTSKLSRDMAFVGTRATVETDQSETVSQDYSLSGKVLGNVALAARYGETLVDGSTASRTRELSLIPAAPKDYGVFHKVAWNLRFAQVQRSDKIETETKAGRVETEVLRHKVAAEYLGTITKEGLDCIVRSFSISGDQDPKKRLHYGLSYKVRDPAGADSILIRRYNADWKITDVTQLTYAYFSYNEKPNGELEPVGVERIKLTTPMTKLLGFVGCWESVDYYANNTSKTTLSLGLSGKLSGVESLEASYGFDRTSTPNGKTSSRTYKLKYDRQVSADHFLTLTGRYTDWSGTRPSNITEDDVQIQLDFRTLFN